MNSDRKKVLITDLDNTLFDWVDLWHACFTAMMGKVIEISGIPLDDLKPEIRKVHQRHGTSEYSFLLEELPSLSSTLAGKSAAQVFQPAIEAYQVERRRKLKLYPTVAETLLKIKGTGAAIVWPAPGSEDTELGVLMEPEVGHGETEVYPRVQA
jgi:FMN phosphatase YigB (HAD superfamily)